MRDESRSPETLVCIESEQAPIQMNNRTWTCGSSSGNPGRLMPVDYIEESKSRNPMTRLGRFASEASGMADARMQRSR